MLRITTIHGDGFERVIKLEGKLLAAWVEELQETCRSSRDVSSRLQLDLSELSYADATGTVALRELIRQGVTVATASPFVGELLKEN